MNREQRDDLARDLYDFAKIEFAALVVGNYALGDKFDQNMFIVGLVATGLTVTTGLVLRRTKRKK